MSQKKSKILIVDDTPKNIQVLGSILDENGYSVVIATSGKQALESVEKTMPDLILLDVMMPEMDGFETCKALKRNSKFTDIPVLFLTAKVETEDIVLGFELGAVDYITKPFNTSELLARVQTHLALRKAHETIARSSNERKELIHVLCHDLTNPIGFLSSIMKMSHNDPAIMETMKSQFEKSIENSLEIIKLVRMMMAINEQKMELIPSSHDLHELIMESLFTLDLRAKKKNITFDISIPADLKVSVERISFVNSILNNIFTNAIKFSMPGGKIELMASSNKGKVTLSIQDHGIGMPQSLLKNLFDLRKKTSRTGTAGEEGTGFGMPLIQKFIQSFGGNIEVQSIEKSEDANNSGTKIILFLNEG
ncbi:MAG: hybrid sensor histidine kinase/response regulator [Spirochaetia bacterium]|nr:hybrid sensor histidine kinase/response regulator [Spirochaetia bacterium]